MKTEPLKLVVLGTGGRLGATLARGFAAEAQVTGFNRSQLDLTSAEALERELGRLDFEVLLNCAGTTSPDYCETHEDEAFAVNAHAVRKIGEICLRKGARCLHFSTDYVFDGEKNWDCTEEDAAEPVNVYGASKRQGEVELLGLSAESHLAIRVSWVFGTDAPGFVDQILRKAMAGEKLEAVADKWTKPTFARDILERLRPFLRELPAGGVLHLTQGGPACSWLEYGQYALDCAAALGVPLKSRSIAPRRMAEIPAFIAKRPVYTGMATRRLEELTGCAARPWKEAVAEYIRKHYAP